MAGQEGLSFTSAFEMLQNTDDGSMYRASWNGVGVIVKIQYPTEQSKIEYPFLYMKKGNGTNTMWVPNTGDLFAQDWIVISGNPIEWVWEPQDIDIVE